MLICYVTYETNAFRSIGVIWPLRTFVMMTADFVPDKLIASMHQFEQNFNIPAPEPLHPRSYTNQPGNPD